jgi:hypothetical protein
MGKKCLPVSDTDHTFKTVHHIACSLIPVISIEYALSRLSPSPFSYFSINQREREHDPFSRCQCNVTVLARGVSTR